MRSRAALDVGCVRQVLLGRRGQGSSRGDGDLCPVFREEDTCRARLVEPRASSSTAGTASSALPITASVGWESFA